MANRVITYFEGDTSHLFKKADEAQARIRQYQQGTSASPAANAQGPSPVVAQEKAVTAAVETEAAKRVQINDRAVRSGFAVYDERAKKVEAAAKQETTFEEARASILARHAQSAIDSDNRVLDARKVRARAETKLLEEQVAKERVITGERSRLAARPATVSPREQAARELVSAIAKQNVELAALEQAASKLEFGEVAKRIKSAKEANVVVLAAREKLLAETALLEKAETKIVQEEAIKRAGARGGALAPSSPIGGAARGAAAGAGGIGGASGLFSGGTFAAAAGFAVAAGSILSLKEYAEKLAEAEQRSRRFATASIELGIAQKDLEASVKGVAASLRITNAEAEKIIAPIAELASQAQKPLGDLKNAVIDVASARGIDNDELPGLLKNIADGTADTALFGRNASTIFDIYASSLGKTADQLSVTEKQQALVNEVLKQGALHAGASADASEKQALSLDGLTKSLKALEEATGGVINQGVKSVVDAATEKLGGQPAYGRFDPSRGGPPLALSPLGLIPARLSAPDPLELYADDLAKSAEEAKIRAQAYIKTFQDAQKEVADAAASPNKDLVNRSIAKLDVVSLFAAGGPDNYEKVKRKAIEDGKTLQDARIQGFEASLIAYAGDVATLKQLSHNIDLEQSLLDPEAYKRLSDKASKALSDGYKQIIEAAQTNLPKLKAIFREIQGAGELNTGDRNELLQATARQLNAGLRDMIADAKTNVPKLRAIFKDVLATPLTPGDRADLIRGINDAITESVKQGKEKVKGLGDAFRSVFDNINSRVAQGNPFLQFLNDSAKRMEALKEGTKGFSAELRNALEQRQETADKFEKARLREDARVDAVGLRNQAQEFNQGRRFAASPGDTLRSTRQSLFEYYKGQFVTNFLSPQEQAQVPLLDLYSKQNQARKDLKDQQSRLDEELNLKTGAPKATLNAQLDPRSIADLKTPGKFGEPGVTFTAEPQIDREARDAKIAARASSLNPADLRPDQRQSIAEALEREAQRRLDQEREAAKQREEQTKIQGKLLKELEKLNGLAASGGLDAIVRVINESDRANVNSRPRQAAVKSKYPSR